MLTESIHPSIGVSNYSAPLRLYVRLFCNLRFLALLAFLCGTTGPTRADEATTRAQRAPIVLTDNARDLHQRSLLVDGHNDLPWEIRKQGSSSFTKLDISQPQPVLH